MASGRLETILKRLDRLVVERKFPNRNRTVSEAVRDKIDRMDRSRLSRESAKMSKRSEQALADEDLAQDSIEWPEY